MQARQLAESYRQQPHFHPYIDTYGETSYTFTLGSVDIHLYPHRSEHGLEAAAYLNTEIVSKDSCSLIIFQSPNILMTKNVVDSYIECNNSMPEVKTITELAEELHAATALEYRGDSKTYLVFETAGHHITVGKSDVLGTYQLTVFDAHTDTQILTALSIRDSRIVEIAFKNIVALVGHSIERVA